MVTLILASGFDDREPGIQFQTQTWSVLFSTPWRPEVDTIQSFSQIVTQESFLRSNEAGGH